MTLKVLKEIEHWDFRFTLFFVKCCCQSFLLLVNKLSFPLVCSNLSVDMPFDQSLPVAFGAETTKWICVGAIDITQLSVAGT